MDYNASLIASKVQISYQVKFYIKSCLAIYIYTHISSYCDLLVPVPGIMCPLYSYTALNEDKDNSEETSTMYSPVQQQQHQRLLLAKGGVHLPTSASSAHGISSYSGSSVKETRMVSPRPSSRRAPMPMALFILPSSPSPASVTPRCNG